jgi:hypothetical protein
VEINGVSLQVPNFDRLKKIHTQPNKHTTIDEHSIDSHSLISIDSSHLVSNQTETQQSQL